jgi:hypothetical protein
LLFVGYVSGYSVPAVGHVLEHDPVLWPCGKPGLVAALFAFGPALFGGETLCGFDHSRPRYVCPPTEAEILLSERGRSSKKA